MPTDDPENLSIASGTGLYPFSSGIESSSRGSSPAATDEVCFEILVMYNKDIIDMGEVAIAFSGTKATMYHGPDADGKLFIT